jgi:putative hydrolase of the HAD superfamily
MIEVATKISGNRVGAETINAIIAIAKRMLNEKIDVLPGVEKTLAALHQRFRLIVITKGDLLDQEKKLERSNLLQYFHHTEVVSDKQAANYEQVFRRLDLDPTSVLMVGNSLKSDVLPVLEIGAQAVHIPFHTTWQHEQATAEEHHDYVELARFEGLLELLG